VRTMNDKSRLGSSRASALTVKRFRRVHALRPRVGPDIEARAAGLSEMQKPVLGQPKRSEDGTDGTSSALEQRSAEMKRRVAKRKKKK